MPREVRVAEYDAVATPWWMRRVIDARRRGRDPLAEALAARERRAATLRAEAAAARTEAEEVSAAPPDGAASPASEVHAEHAQTPPPATAASAKDAPIRRSKLARRVMSHRQAAARVEARRVRASG